jgi:hypothetical protein
VSGKPMMNASPVALIITYANCNFRRFDVNLLLTVEFSNLLAGIISGNHVSMTAEGTVYLLHFERPYKARCGIIWDGQAIWSGAWRITVRALHARQRNWPSIEGSGSSWLALGPAR